MLNLQCGLLHEKRKEISWLESKTDKIRYIARHLGSKVAKRLHGSLFLNHFVVDEWILMIKRDFQTSS